MKRTARVVGRWMGCVVVALTGSAPAAILTQDTFGTGAHQFDLMFVEVGNPGNPNDTGTTGLYSTPFGGVSYAYRMGQHEISQNDISRATAGGLLHVAAGAGTGTLPAANISWLEAAAFANWLNTSEGFQAAYNLTDTGSGWSMNLWSSAQAWTDGGTNLFRHKDAHYFLPSEDEWYKAAFYSGSGSTYYDYATGSDAVPTPVASGTNSGTVVYAQSVQTPADVTTAGGLSPYGTMGQNGNLWEWNESADDGYNNSASEPVGLRGGDAGSYAFSLSASARPSPSGAAFEHQALGFRVASIVPEPGSALALLAAATARFLHRRRETPGRAR